MRVDLIGLLAVVLAAAPLACGGQALIAEPGSPGSHDAGSGAAGSGGNQADGSPGTGGRAGGGSAGTAGDAGAGGEAGAPVDGGGSDSSSDCFDNSGCPPSHWCDIEPAGPGVCSSGGKAGECKPRPDPSLCPDYQQCPGACGCDGTLFCDACEAHAKGIPVTADNQWCREPVGEPCGGFAGLQCPANAYCDYPSDDACGAADSMGTCAPRPQACPPVCPGACGCDGQFYCSECDAAAKGVDITGGTECFASKPRSNDDDCQPGLKCCYPCGIPGCTKQCVEPTPQGVCPQYP